MKHLKNILLILTLIVVDQLSKLYFIGKNIEIFKYFSFSYLQNTGGVFGILKNSNFYFILLTLIIIFVVVYYYDKDKKFSLGFNFLLAGAFDNLIDRVFRGYVIDFIDFKIWPVFNLADVFITLGVLIIVYKTLKEKG